MKQKLQSLQLQYDLVGPGPGDLKSQLETDSQDVHLLEDNFNKSKAREKKKKAMKEVGKTSEIFRIKNSALKFLFQSEIQELLAEKENISRNLSEEDIARSDLHQRY